MGRLRASKEEIREFINSGLYQDFLDELDIRINELTVYLDDFDRIYNGRDYDMFRGGKRNMMEMKRIFPEFLSTFTMEEEYNG